jgi:hypothetical protein
METIEFLVCILLKTCSNFFAIFFAKCFGETIFKNIISVAAISSERTSGDSVRIGGHPDCCTGRGAPAANENPLLHPFAGIQDRLHQLLDLDGPGNNIFYDFVYFIYVNIFVCQQVPTICIGDFLSVNFFC